MTNEQHEQRIKELESKLSALEKKFNTLVEITKSSIEILKQNQINIVENMEESDEVYEIINRF